VPKQLDQLQEFIWRRFEAAYPDEDDINPIYVDFANGCYFVFFSDQVRSYGFNDVYTYMPTKRRWGIIYGNDAAGSYRNLGRKTTFKKILARVEKLMHPELYSENPGYELRHYVVELTPTGGTKRWVKIGKRDWTPDWSEATAVAGEMTAKHPRSAGFEVVSEPMSMQANPGRNRFSELAARDLLPVAIWSESVPPHALLEWRGPRGDIWAITDRAGNDVLAEFARQYADAPAGKKNPASATVYAWLAVLKSKLTQYDRKESMRELRRGHENIYRLGHLLGAAQSVEKAVGPYLNRDDAEALAAFEGAMDFAFTPNFPPVNNVKRQLAKYRASGKLPSLVG